MIKQKLSKPSLTMKGVDGDIFLLMQDFRTKPRLNI